MSIQENQKSHKLTTYGFIVAGVIILILLGIVIFRKPIDNYTPFDAKPYLEKIKNLEEENKKLRSENNKIDKENIMWQAAYDSLESSKPKIKIVYAPQKAFIPNATDTQLDSIIRANLRKRTRQ